MPVRQHSDARSDGQSLGQSRTDLISFYGVTTIVQPATTTQAAVTTGATTTQVGALVNELRTALVNLGLIKGSL
tara:strand:- start:16922 stop:17143 length:222 start_codon:yes stop_codon:yes gene_type:complete